MLDLQITLQDIVIESLVSFETTGVGIVIM